MIIFTYYGMPLHLLRDLWMSIRNLQRRIITYFRYRRITANMNERFPSPTDAELDETDRICIICREEMTPDTCKKLPCSHIFHLNCLRMWLQRQQTCPTCRANIPTERPPDVVPGEARPPAAPVADPVVPPDQAPVPPVIPPPRADAERRYHPNAPPPPAQPTPGNNPAATSTTRQIPTPARPFGPIPVNIPSPAPSVSGATIPPALHGIMDPAHLHYMQSMHYGLQLDPMYLQYQLDMLQAQLYVLRATSLALQSGALSSAGFTVPPTPAYHVPPVVPTAAPGTVPASTTVPPVVPPVPPPVPATVGIPSPTEQPTSIQLSPATTPPSVSSPPPAIPSNLTSSTFKDDEVKESDEKPVVIDSPVIKEPKPQPAPMTEEEIERERRREELRRIYEKRYGGSTSDAGAKEDGDTQ
ncbi:hypothetical protein THRCLA_05429 [Thraustotheca clavata]|uniref:RING-type E3 ubiquitin transferase n=1 Tax=Thraustotheca clavata TaxID=74557 RepID=A0A1V9ZVY6_9STRA|nr:hypothetical protein THRCLA_05429 [Thraustotheca clavata]